MYRSHVPHTAAEAGRTSISIISVEPWSTAAEALQPKFGLSAADAKAAAIADTQLFERRLLDALQLGIALSPAVTSITETATSSISASGESADSSERMVEKGPGSVEGAAALQGGAVGDRNAQAVPSRMAGFEGLAAGKDPFLTHKVAAALYQEVGLLDRYIANAALRYDYTPYVVRAQLSSIPYARFQPLDAYATISFFVDDD